MRSLKRRLRPILLTLTVLLVITQIVFLSPTVLEETPAKPLTINSEELILDQGPTLVPGLPKARVAEYNIETFTYVSVQNGIKQWKIDAENAFLYNPERLVHARRVKAFLFDPEGKVTVVTGLEAKYFLNRKNLEIFGNVKTVFPDGFELYSEYLQYTPQTSRIFIPKTHLATGLGQENQGQRFQFVSHGLDYDMGKALIKLLSDVTVTLTQASGANPEAGGVPENTKIESDRCLIHRQTKLAEFDMEASRPLKARFVHITQPTLFAKGRRADLSYGDFHQILQYLTAYEDVFIKEKGETESLRYATGGRADFDTRRDLIVLTQFPQVYQNEDTVTGDVIVMHRDTDVIEVKHSNAFSTGKE